MQCTRLKHHACCGDTILQLAVSRSGASSDQLEGSLLVAARTAHILQLLCLELPQLPGDDPPRLTTLGVWRAPARPSHVTWHPRRAWCLLAPRIRM